MGIVVYASDYLLTSGVLCTPRWGGAISLWCCRSGDRNGEWVLCSRGKGGEGSRQEDKCAEENRHAQRDTAELNDLVG